ncbi:MAG: leucine-rich repeat domain-containing protein, partial [Clostridia bacterium]|nr:leucine-rich repeat domain-containing protein [Clostridia bacterium]
MKKRLLFFIAMMATLMCFMAISASAAIHTSTSDEYNSEITTLDPVVGRTDIDGNKDDGTIARTVLRYAVVTTEGEGEEAVEVTTYYYITVPTTYLLTTNPYGKYVMQLDMTAFSNAFSGTELEGIVFDKTSIIRFEMPIGLAGTGNSSNPIQNFYGFSNCKQIVLKKNCVHQSKTMNSLFQGCNNLEEIVNIESLTSSDSNPTIGGMYQDCKKLKNAKIPAGVTQIGGNAFLNCYELDTITVDVRDENGNIISTTYENGILILPETVTSIGANNASPSFSGCRKLTYVKMSTNLNFVCQNAFAGCTSLVFVDFTGVTDLTGFYNCSNFSGCTSLKAISLPEGITNISNRVFDGCKALEAVYLPSTLVTISGNNENWNHGAFNNCSNMYFTDKPFSVNQYIVDGKVDLTNYQAPNKPDVYFMPDSFTEFYANSAPFSGCYNLNKTIVFGDNFKSFVTTHSNATYAYNVFNNINSSKGEVKNIVFLGDMSDFGYSSSVYNINFYFVNSADTGIGADIVDVKSSATKNVSESKLIFCKVNCYYNLTPAVADLKIATETDEETQETVNSSVTHLRNPNLDKITVEATCLDNSIGATYCFCSAKISEGEMENTALGHNFVDDFDCVTDNECSRCDEVEKALYTAHAFVRSIVYSDFSANGVKNCDCTNEGCTKYDEKDAVAAPIFTANGYSVREDGKALLGGYTIDTEALKAYNLYNNTKLTYGIVMSNAANVQFDENNAYIG